MIFREIKLNVKCQKYAQYISMTSVLGGHFYHDNSCG